LIDDEEFYRSSLDPFPSFLNAENIDGNNLSQPSRPQADLLCSLYFKNIDPFLKLLHRPRFFYDLSQFRRGVLNHSVQFEALLSTMFYLTLISLSEEYVCTNFESESKAKMMDNFRKLAEKTLVRSGFMQSHSLVSFQAYLLYLVSLIYPVPHQSPSSPLSLPAPT